MFDYVDSIFDFPCGKKYVLMLPKKKITRDMNIFVSMVKSFSDVLKRARYDSFLIIGTEIVDEPTLMRKSDAKKITINKLHLLSAMTKEELSNGYVQRPTKEYVFETDVEKDGTYNVLDLIPNFVKADGVKYVKKSCSLVSLYDENGSNLMSLAGRIVLKEKYSFGNTTEANAGRENKISIEFDENGIMIVSGTEGRRYDIKGKITLEIVRESKDSNTKFTTNTNRVFKAFRPKLHKDTSPTQMANLICYLLRINDVRLAETMVSVIENINFDTVDKLSIPYIGEMTLDEIHEVEVRDKLLKAAWLDALKHSVDKNYLFTVLKEVEADGLKAIVTLGAPDWFMQVVNINDPSAPDVIINLIYEDSKIFSIVYKESIERKLGTDLDGNKARLINILLTTYYGYRNGYLNHLDYTRMGATIRNFPWKSNYIMTYSKIRDTKNKDIVENAEMFLGHLKAIVTNDNIQNNLPNIVVSIELKLDEYGNYIIKDTNTCVDLTINRHYLA